MQPLRVFIGMDERQPVAYTMAQTSFMRNSSRPVAITALRLSQLPLTRRGLTDFTYARYLVPWLCNYEGHALFVDGDVLCLGDVAELPWDAPEAVSIVPHTTVQKNGETVSVQFERPSVMLFNCAACKRLTPEYIQSGKPQTLEWAPSIGELPKPWNYLVGYNTGGDAKLAHFTMGLPCFDETAKDEFAADWAEIAAYAGKTCTWEELMGDSVHAKWKQKPAVLPFLKHQGFR
jgi:hypothetical protein